jgi:2-oxoglutarate ferredoxin oxidoreductase subunit alpha
MNRVSLKIVGASGQGINSIGEILAKGLKRAGYCVFGYREYPSLIKGGHASYQLDVSDERVESTETCVDVVVTLNHHGLEKNLVDLKEGGVFIHSVSDWTFSDEQKKLIARKKLKVIELPVDQTLKTLNAKPILGNVLIAAFLWAMLDCDKEALKSLVGERFAKKKALLDANMQCIDAGYAHVDSSHGKISVKLPAPNSEWTNAMLITGSQAMGLGAVHAGVRFYAGYPMTPSSPLLTYIADLQNVTGMAIKQAEDEITAAQLVSGAMHMGTRALTGTSGGGFDLMSETLSMNAIIENPTVFVLAQRPGPATGLPTWTGQGDLFLAVYTAHGEFARCVLSVSDAEDAFHLMPIAFNIAEKYQISVIVLTDKQIAEALYTQHQFDQTIATIDRGNVITKQNELDKLSSSDRFDPKAKDGVSPRWFPGSRAATYNAQADEHSGDGSVDESDSNAIQQMEKRMKKLDALKTKLPEPEFYGAQNPDILLVGWGSTKGAVFDAIKDPSLAKAKIGYLHYSYLWPLKTDKLMELSAKAKHTVLIEQNYQGQLGQLIRMECGLDLPARILKYDGRPFFVDELVHHFSNI